MRAWMLLLGSAFGAFIGYAANRVAIWMLFHPRRAIQLGPIRVQGVFPKRRREIAENIANTVERNILSPEDVRKMISEAVELKLREVKLPIPLPSETREMLELAIRRVVVTVTTSLLSQMSENMSVSEFILRKFDEVSDEELERMFLDAVGKELRYIALNDALIGALVGALEMALLSFLH